jgi:F0F1-type ATP synthase membrane subunit b/b'
MTQHNTKNKDGASPDKQQKNKKIKLLIKIYVQEVPKNIEKLLKDNKPIAVDLPYHRYEKIIETSVSKKYINKMFNDLASYMDEWDQFLADHNYYKDCNDL